MYHIVVYNIARARFPMDDLRMKGFTDAIDQVNAEAESSQGFMWRLKDESGNATNIRIYDDPNMLVNLSVWESAEDLKAYLYNGNHLKIFLRKKEWFDPLEGTHMVLWWIEKGKIPTAEQGKEKIKLLDEEGPSLHAFGYSKLFDPPA